MTIPTRNRFSGRGSKRLPIRAFPLPAQELRAPGSAASLLGTTASIGTAASVTSLRTSATEAKINASSLVAPHSTRQLAGAARTGGLATPATGLPRSPSRSTRRRLVLRTPPEATTLLIPTAGGDRSDKLH